MQNPKTRPPYFPLERQIVVMGTQAALSSFVNSVGYLDVLLKHPAEWTARDLEDLKADVARYYPGQNHGSVADAVRAKAVDWLRSLVEGAAVQCWRLSVGPAVSRANAIDRANDEPTVLAEPVQLVGDQHTVAGSPAGPHATKHDFDSQWAWSERAGIALLEWSDPAGGGPMPRLSEQTGANIRVGVFDSSSFPIATASKTVPLHWDSAATLMVHHPVVHELAQAGGMQIGWPSAPASASLCPDHGISVVSLIHNVAPDSEIHLFRVLSPYLVGTADCLTNAMIPFVAQAETDLVAQDPSSKPLIDGAVINLSLHMEIDPTAAWPFGLWCVIHDAVKHGIVVVAAAGNASQASKAALPTTFPASGPDVISVQGHDTSRRRAWFSNLGEVSAPGTGLVVMVDNQPHATEGYRWASGTSFATAVVSGICALALEAKASSGSPDPATAAAAVRNAVRDGMSRPSDGSHGDSEPIIGSKGKIAHVIDPL